MKKLLATAMAGAAMICVGGTAHAALTFTASSVSLVYSGAPTGDLHKTSSPTVSAGDVRLSPQTIRGSFSNDPSKVVDLFGYCVDIFDAAGPTKFNVVSLSDYLSGKGNGNYDLIGQLIANEGGTHSKLHDASVQLAVWELMNETLPNLDINKITETSQVKSGYHYEWKNGRLVKVDDYKTVTTTPKQFWVDDVKNGSGVLTNANNFLGAAQADAGDPLAGYSFYVLQSDGSRGKQDFLYWTYTPPPVPEAATWGMMILGFGAMGSVLRRRKVAVSFG